jgi:hypothetical protein
MIEIKGVTIESPFERILVSFLPLLHIMVAVLIAAAVVPFAAHAQGSVDFSGIWRMDDSRSESAHQGAPIGPVTMIVKQSGNDLSIETRGRDSDSSTVHSEILNYKLDGTETTTEGSDGTPIKSKAHWEGTKLVVETERNIQKSPVTTSYVYSLDPEGKEMTINKTLTVQHGYQAEGAHNIGTGTDVFIKTQIASE